MATAPLSYAAYGNAPVMPRASGPTIDFSDPMVRGWMNPTGLQGEWQAARAGALRDLSMGIGDPGELESIMSAANFEDAKARGDPWALNRDHSFGAQLKALAKGAGVIGAGLSLGPLLGLAGGGAGAVGAAAPTAAVTTPFTGAAAPVGQALSGGGMELSSLLEPSSVVNSLAGLASGDYSNIPDIPDEFLTSATGEYSPLTGGALQGQGAGSNWLANLANGGSGAGGLLARLASGALGGTGAPGSNLFSSLFDLAQGLYGANRAGTVRDTAREAAQMQDPFGPYRAQYANQLASLMANPNSVTQLPGWDAGIQAVRRSAAGRGYLDSGNEVSALMNFGGQFFGNEADRLSKLAGAQFGPSGGNLLLAGNNDYLNLLGNSLNRVSRAGGGVLGNLFG